MLTLTRITLKNSEVFLHDLTFFSKTINYKQAAVSHMSLNISYIQNTNLTLLVGTKMSALSFSY